MRIVVATFLAAALIAATFGRLGTGFSHLGDGDDIRQPVIDQMLRVLAAERISGRLHAGWRTCSDIGTAVAPTVQTLGYLPMSIDVFSEELSRLGWKPVYPTPRGIWVKETFKIDVWETAPTKWTFSMGGGCYETTKSNARELLARSKNFDFQYDD